MNGLMKMPVPKHDKNHISLQSLLGIIEKINSIVGASDYHKQGRKDGFQSFGHTGAHGGSH
jgi:hypothetical protein